VGRIVAEDLDSHMIGASLEVFTDTTGHPLDRAPGDEGVDDPVAAAIRKVVFVEARPEQVSAVIRQLEVRAEIPPGESASVVRRRLDDYGHLGAQQPVGTDDLARSMGVLDRHEVRMGTVGAFGGQSEHARSERRQHTHGGRRLQCGSVEVGIVHGVEIVPHGLDRSAVAMTSG
jgi:hypothetical protein